MTTKWLSCQGFPLQALLHAANQQKKMEWEKTCVTKDQPHPPPPSLFDVITERPLVSYVW